MSNKTFCSLCKHHGTEIQQMPCKVGYLHYMSKGYDCPYFEKKTKEQDRLDSLPGGGLEAGEYN